MGFDLADLDTLTLGEAGVPMPITNLRTGAVEMNADGTPVTITLASQRSEAFRDALKKIQETRAEMIGKKEVVDQRHREKEDIVTLIACTRDWTIQTLGGEPFPCTTANIRKLWNDPRFTHLREAGIQFIMGDVNFLPQRSSSSSATLDTSSSSAAPSPAAAPSETLSATTG